MAFFFFGLTSSRLLSLLIGKDNYCYSFFLFKRSKTRSTPNQLSSAEKHRHSTYIFKRRSESINRFGSSNTAEIFLAKETACGQKTEPSISGLIRVWSRAFFLLKDGITQLLSLGPC